MPDRPTRAAISTDRFEGGLPERSDVPSRPCWDRVGRSVVAEPSGRQDMVERHQTAHAIVRAYRPEVAALKHDHLTPTSRPGVTKMLVMTLYLARPFEANARTGATEERSKRPTKFLCASAPLATKSGLMNSNSSVTRPRIICRRSFSSPIVAAVVNRSMESEILIRPGSRDVAHPAARISLLVRLSATAGPSEALTSSYASRRLSTQKVTPRSPTATTTKIPASIPWKAQNLFAGWYFRNPW
jgi:hypothetical protein